MYTGAKDESADMCIFNIALNGLGDVEDSHLERNLSIVLRMGRIWEK